MQIRIIDVGLVVARMGNGDFGIVRDDEDRTASIEFEGLCHGAYN